MRHHHGTFFAAHHLFLCHHHGFFINHHGLHFLTSHRHHLSIRLLHHHLHFPARNMANDEFLKQHLHGRWISHHFLRGHFNMFVVHHYQSGGFHRLCIVLKFSVGQHH